MSNNASPINNEIQFYLDKYPNILIEVGSRFGLNHFEGFSYSTDGGISWGYVHQLSDLDSTNKIKSINESLAEYGKKLDFKKQYPFLIIGKQNIWIAKVPGGICETSCLVEVPQKKSFSFLNTPPPHDLLLALNEEGSLLHSDPKDSFFCTLCNKTYKKVGSSYNGVSLDSLLNVDLHRYGDRLFAGVYCTVCLEKNSDIKKEIHRSKTEPNYFD